LNIPALWGASAFQEVLLRSDPLMTTILTFHFVMVTLEIPIVEKILLMV
jgi:hypothetical protein